MVIFTSFNSCKDTYKFFYTASLSLKLKYSMGLNQLLYNKRLVYSRFNVFEQAVTYKYTFCLKLLFLIMLWSFKVVLKETVQKLLFRRS